MADMNRCTSTTRRWPDAPVDVHPDEEEEFLAHAEDCPYHAAALEAEGEQLISSLRKDYRLARMFGRGRILEGEELKSAAADRRAQLERWYEAAAKGELPFSHIALINNGAEKARYSNLYNLNIHDGVHQLDPDAGIEIWGVVASNGLKVEAWLASYDFAAAPPGKEEVFDLKNGYTVALKVKQEDEERFRIKFKFVETEELKRVKQGESKPEARAATAGGGGASAGLRPLAKRASPERRAPRPWGGLRLPLTCHQVGQWACCVLLIATLGIRAGVQPGRNSSEAGRNGVPRPEKPNRATNGPQTAAGNPSAGAGLIKEHGDNKAAQPPSKQKHGKAQLDSAGEAPQVASKEQKEIASLLKDNTRQGGHERVSDNRGESRDGSNAVPHTRPRRVADQDQPKPGQALLAFLDTHQPQERLILFDFRGHEELKEPLRKMLKERGLEVRPITDAQTLSPAHELSKVNLFVAPEENAIKLFARIEVDGKTYPMSFRGVGETDAVARTDALKEAVPSVFNKINELRKEQAAHAPADASSGGGDSFNDGKAYRSHLIDQRGRPFAEGTDGRRNDGCA